MVLPAKLRLSPGTKLAILISYIQLGHLFPTDQSTVRMIKTEFHLAAVTVHLTIDGAAVFHRFVIDQLLRRQEQPLRHRLLFQGMDIVTLPEIGSGYHCHARGLPGSRNLTFNHLRVIFR